MLHADGSNPVTMVTSLRQTGHHFFNLAQHSFSDGSSFSCLIGRGNGHGLPHTCSFILPEQNGPQVFTIFADNFTVRLGLTPLCDQTNIENSYYVAEFGSVN